ncbi:SDR family oxidoreductase [Streptomyces misionensis]|uniref:SDR family oxidoreductase n=1 Tax=Streptomyces misionensis TaxID=67331 RepID=UPI0036FB8EA8
MTAADTGGTGTGAGAGPGPVTFRLDGRTALVTGSARGLGLEMARGVAGAGARVVLNGRDPAGLAAAAERLRAGVGYDVTTAAFDVTDRPATEHAVEEPGDLDILVDNVGHRDRRGVAEMSPQELHALLDTDLTSAYALSQTVARGLAARGVPGRIVNVSSVMGQLGRTGDVGYATAKAALDGLTRALAAGLGPSGTTVNSVAPGTFATEANGELTADPDWERRLRTRTAPGRWGRPEEIAAVVVFLASDAATFITGRTIAVDGGMTTTF